MILSNLQVGEIAIVDRILVNEKSQSLAQRLEAMGIIPERPLQVLRKSRFGGNLHVRVGTTTEIALREREAKMIIVKVV